MLSGTLCIFVAGVSAFVFETKLVSSDIFVSEATSGTMLCLMDVQEHTQRRPQNEVWKDDDVIFAAVIQESERQLLD